MELHGAAAAIARRQHAYLHAMVARASSGAGGCHRVECVPGFDRQMLEELLAQDYSLAVLKFSPTLFGEPVERIRKYMVLLKERALEWHPAIQQHGVEESFLNFFARTMRMTGTSKFRDPAEEISAYLEDQALRQKLPSRTRSGKRWSCYQLFSRLRNLLVNKRFLRDLGWPICPRRRSSCRPSALCFRPFSGRRSCGSFAERRCPVPMELFEYQGWNIWGAGTRSRLPSRDDDPPQSQPAQLAQSQPAQLADDRGFDVAEVADALRCQFVEQLRSLTEPQIRSVSGNSMHLTAIGATLLFCLGCTQPPQHA